MVRLRMADDVPSVDSCSEGTEGSISLAGGRNLRESKMRVARSERFDVSNNCAHTNGAACAAIASELPDAGCVPAGHPKRTIMDMAAAGAATGFRTMPENRDLFS